MTLESSRVAPSVEDVRFHPHSFCDPGGRLFEWDGKIYRGITGQYAPILHRLVQCGLIDKLVQRGLLIDTKIAPWTLDGYEMAVWHRSVSFPSYPTEWCPAMFKRAAMTTLELAIELAPHGLTLHDAHPWNLLVDRTEPVYVDLTSIRPFEDELTWPAEGEFNRFCLYPLLLMSRGYDRIARRLLATDEGITRDYVDKLTHTKTQTIGRLLSAAIITRFKRMVKKDVRTPRSLQESLLALREEIQELQFPHLIPSTGRDESEVSLSPWRSEILGILERLRPDSVLIEGRDHAWAAQIAAGLRCHAITFSTDIGEVSRLYDKACRHRLSILPLVMDLAKPTPSMGVANHWLVAASERLRCQAVIALDLLPAMVHRRRLNLRNTVEDVARFTSRWLLTEHVDMPPYLAKAFPSEPISLHDMVSDLRTVFSKVLVVRRPPIAGTLILCEK